MVRKTPFPQALADQQVSAVLRDVDLYRIHGGMAVETDYIIRVECKRNKGGDSEPSFETFTISKTFSHFRTFAKQLKMLADNAMSAKERKRMKTDEVTKDLLLYCETVHQLIESQRHQYIGKVNYKYVKVLAEKRSHIVREILVATLNHFPLDSNANMFSMNVSHTIETLFLTDHCTEGDGPHSDEFKNYSAERLRPSANSNFVDERQSLRTPAKIRSGDNQPMTTPSTPVVPRSKKRRNSVSMRKLDQDELEKVGKTANLFVDVERPQSGLAHSYSARTHSLDSSGSMMGGLFETNPIAFVVYMVGLLFGLRRVSTITVTVDLDVLMLIAWAFYCIGFHSPRDSNIDGIDETVRPPPTPPSNATDLHGRSLLRSMSRKMSNQDSIASTRASAGSKPMDFDGDNDVMNEIQSPLQEYPKGAKLGTHFNCWSHPVCDNFSVRGPNYLKDGVKIESGDFLWPVRGVDLFLTDTPPENAGRITQIMGGRLRDVPTLIINFRLPWGVLLTYCEIPKMYLPFIRAGHDPDFDKSTLPSMNRMTPSQRCAARYCQSSAEEKDNLLKIVPGVADGPWVVKSVVGNKPAILGTKMPVSYVYQKEENGKAMYLEMDLDIVASSAARGILSMVRKYTNGLTLDLGFVVQGNKEDELPEQMLTATRLHGLDPLNAPALPVSQEQVISNLTPGAQDSDDDDF